MNARNIIQSEYSGQPNFMTPTVLGYAMLRRMRQGFGVAVELATGEGFGGSTIYGVSVVRAYPWGTRRLHNMSRCCFSREEADLRIRTLKDGLKRG